VVAHQPPADLERAEVAGDHDHSAPVRTRGLHVFQALDDKTAPHRSDRPPPGPRELEQADAQRGEVFPQQRLAPGRVQPGKAQLEIARRDLAPVAGQHAQRGAQAAPDRALPHPGQVRDQRHQADAQPCRPVARRQRRWRKRGVCGHARIVVGWRRPQPERWSRRGGYLAQGMTAISPVASCALRIAVASFTRSCAFPIPDSRFPAILSPMPTADTTERLLRGLYSTALYLLVPVTVYHLIWRGFRQEAYFERWSERYARYATPAAPTPIWV